MIGGRYSIDREIGRGGSGAVWLGRDEVLGRPVALKQIGLLHGADRTDVARAEREARLSASLHHPHVVAVFDVVIDPETDVHWLVMEYVDGVDLGRLVRDQGPLEPDAAAPLLHQAADALLAAHAAGIAHRDVKPANVMIDQHGQAKLTDFGIARIATDPSLTQTGMVTGSPAYLAPEVAAGDRGDKPADVWALGATAYFLLTGRPPYDVGDNVMGAMYRIVHEEPPRLPESTAGWLAPLLEHTMVRDPSHRWSMEQARDFLARAPRPSESTATRVMGTVAPPPGTSAAPAPRHRPSRELLAGLGLVLAAALAVVLVVALSDEEPGSGGSAGTTRTPSPTATSSTPESRPTAAGMKAFIRDYVATVSADPAESWQMLTPKFQQESGGFETYRDFWEDATNGRVLSISADPESLTVSYQVRFDNFDNGPGPTILELVYEGGRYLINGERTEGFEPAG